MALKNDHTVPEIGNAVKHAEEWNDPIGVFFWILEGFAWEIWLNVRNHADIQPWLSGKQLPHGIGSEPRNSSRCRPRKEEKAAGGSDHGQTARSHCQPR